MPLPSFPYPRPLTSTAPELDLALPALAPEAADTLRALERVMMGPGDLDAFQPRLDAWRASLTLDPVFREDRLSDVLTCLVVQSLEPHRATVALDRLGRAVDALLAEGAMLDHIPPTGGDYVLSRVTSVPHPARWAVAQLLLDRGADPMQARNGRHPWVKALAEREETFVRAALEHQGKGYTLRLDDALYQLINGLNTPDDVEHRPIVPVAMALLDAGAPVDGHRFETGTPFVQAVSHGYLDLAQALLDRGADRFATRSAIRAMDNDQGWTALHLVAAEDNPTACVWLIERGLDPQALSFNRATPLAIAREHEAWSAVAALERLELQQDLRTTTTNTPIPGDRARARL